MIKNRLDHTASVRDGSAPGTNAALVMALLALMAYRDGGRPAKWWGLG